MNQTDNKKEKLNQQYQTYIVQTQKIFVLRYLTTRLHVRKIQLLRNKITQIITK